MSPSIEILEQPAVEKLRFRYKSEKPCSVLEGITSSKEKKTYPTIRIIDYTGMASIDISLVTHTDPYRPHPHKILYKGTGKMKMRSEGNALKMDVNVNGAERIVLDGISVMCEKRENIRNSDNYKYNVVRLAFGLYINGVCECRVIPEPIYDSKSITKLIISDISTPSSVVTGGGKIMLFCDKVQKRDIVVEFLDKINGVEYVWSTIEPYVHSQTGIRFIIPAYHKLDIDRPVKTYLRLMRPSDNFKGPTVSFQFYPQNLRTRKTIISPTANCLTVNLGDSTEAKRDTLTIFNIEPTVATPSQLTPRNNQENQLNEPNVSTAQQQIPEFQQPPQSFQTRPDEQNTYPNPMYNMQPTMSQSPAYTQQTYQQPAYPDTQQVNKSYGPPQIQNANANYDQAEFVPTFDAIVQLPPQPAPSNWNMQNYSADNCYRDGNVLGEGYKPLNNDDLILVPSTTVANPRSESPNLFNILYDLKDIDDFDYLQLSSSLSSMSISENETTLPTR